MWILGWEYMNFPQSGYCGEQTPLGGGRGGGLKWCVSVVKISCLNCLQPVTTLQGKVMGIFQTGSLWRLNEVTRLMSLGGHEYTYFTFNTKLI